MHTTVCAVVAVLYVVIHRARTHCLAGCIRKQFVEMGDEQFGETVPKRELLTMNFEFNRAKVRTSAFLRWLTGLLVAFRLWS